MIAATLVVTLTKDEEDAIPHVTQDFLRMMSNQLVYHPEVQVQELTEDDALITSRTVGDTVNLVIHVTDD